MTRRKFLQFNQSHRMLRRATLSILALIISASSYAGHLYKAVLSGSNHNHLVQTEAKGEIWARLTGSELKVWGSFSNLAGDFDATIAGGSHIHAGFAGQNGVVEIILDADVSTDLRSGSYDSIDNTYSLSSAQLAMLKARGLYVNIHTKAYGAGELRAQLVAAASTVYQSKAFGSNQLHRVLSNGSGAFILELNGNSLTVSGSFANLESDFDASIAGGIHLHNALPGVNGGVEVILKAMANMDLRGGILSADSNQFTLTNAQVEMLKKRMMYVNIHSKDYQLGELRGQVVPQTHGIYRVYLSGATQSPVVTTRANGQIIMEYWDDTLTVSGQFSGLSSLIDTALFGGAHIHSGYAGQAGGVEMVLNIDYDTDYMGGKLMAKDNVFALTTAQKAMLFGRQLYVNIHSKKNGAGELRGQIVPSANYYFNAILSGSQQTHSVVSTASGNIITEVHGDWVIASGSFMNLGSDLDVSIAGGAHFHTALAGANGGVRVLLDITADMDLRGGSFMPTKNAWQVSSGLLDTMKARWIYVNIHSKDQQAGELRGQMLAEANAYLWSKLSGTSHTPAVRSMGWGSTALEVRGNEVALSGAFSNLGSEFDVNIAGGAHIHSGLPGSNGGIVAGLMVNLSTDKMSGSFEAANNNWMMSDGAIDSLMWRMDYVNLHTKGVGSGEIRGQILNTANAYFTTTLSGLNEASPIMTPAIGAMKFEMNGDRLTSVGSFSGLDSKVDVSIAGGAHLHTGKNGSNGGVAIILKGILDADEKGGWFGSDSNSVMLTSAQKASLMANDFYVNIHSINEQAGVLRGQVVAEVNSFPNADAKITAPADGMKISIVGDGNTKIDVKWDAATDPEMDGLTYWWELSTDVDFKTVNHSMVAGSGTTVSLKNSQFDSILLSLGVLLNIEKELYHRVVASDGNVQTAGLAQSVFVTRGMIVSDDRSLTNDKLEIYPSLNNGSFRIVLPEGLIENSRLYIVDMDGRIVHTENIGKNTLTKEFQLNNLSSGRYAISIITNNKLVHGDFLIE